MKERSTLALNKTNYLFTKHYFSITCFAFHYIDTSRQPFNGFFRHAVPRFHTDALKGVHLKVLRGRAGIRQAENPRTHRNKFHMVKLNGGLSSVCLDVQPYGQATVSIHLSFHFIKGRRTGTSASPAKSRMLPPPKEHTRPADKR